MKLKRPLHAKVVGAGDGELVLIEEKRSRRWWSDTWGAGGRYWLCTDCGALVVVGWFTNHVAFHETAKEGSAT